MVFHLLALFDVWVDCQSFSAAFLLVNTSRTSASTCSPATMSCDRNLCREVVRPQTLLDYDQGGMLNHIYGKLWWLQAQSAHPISNNPGFEVCIAVRFKDYKWVGLNNKVYRWVRHEALTLTVLHQHTLNTAAHMLMQ